LSNMLKTIEELGDDICDYCRYTENGPVNTGPHNLCEGAGCDEAYERYIDDSNEEEEEVMGTKRVIFSGKVTAVIWDDSTKTIVRCTESDMYDKTKGFLMAYFQKHSGLSKKQTSNFFKEMK